MKHCGCWKNSADDWPMQNMGNRERAIFGTRRQTSQGHGNDSGLTRKSVLRKGCAAPGIGIARNNNDRTASVLRTEQLLCTNGSAAMLPHAGIRRLTVEIRCELCEIVDHQIWG